MTTTNKERVETARTTRTRKPLAYNEACWRYVEWSEREAANEGIIPLGIPTPNWKLSQVVGSTWRLKNVNGLLAKVGWNGRVCRGRKEAE
jgi:hypothetical protein